MIALYYPVPITATVPTGPYLWTVGGIVSCWLITRQKEAEAADRDAALAALRPAPAPCE